MAENTITIIGNLTDDPDLRYTPNGVAVTNFSVAVNRRFMNKETNQFEDKLDGFFRCNVWRDYAENVAESLTKGTRVLVQGRLISRSYEDKEGQTKWVTEIEADEVAPTLKWAKAKVERITRSGARGDADQKSSWAGAPPANTPPSEDDVPF